MIEPAPDPNALPAPKERAEEMSVKEVLALIRENDDLRREIVRLKTILAESERKLEESKTAIPAKKESRWGRWGK